MDNLVVDDKTQRFVFADTLASGQGLVKRSTLVEVLATRALPVNNTPILARQVALSKYIVGDISKPLKAFAEVGEFDALGHDFAVGFMKIDIAEPENRGQVLNEQIDSAVRAFSSTDFKERSNAGGRLDLCSVFLLPPSSRTILGIDEALLEYIVKHVF